MCYGYHICSKEALMQAENDDLDGGQRSSEVKWGKRCDMATIFWSKELVMQAKNDDDLHGGQRSSEFKYGCKLRMMTTFTEVKGHQRSNVVNYATFLNIVIFYYQLMRRDVWFGNHLVHTTLHFPFFFLALFSLFTFSLPFSSFLPSFQNFPQTSQGWATRPPLVTSLVMFTYTHDVSLYTRIMKTAYDCQQLI